VRAGEAIGMFTRKRRRLRKALVYWLWRKEREGSQSLAWVVVVLLVLGILSSLAGPKTKPQRVSPKRTALLPAGSKWTKATTAAKELSQG